MVSLASVHHWLFMKAMTSSMVCIELKTKCHRQHDLNIYHISILDSGSRPAAASLRFMPSDAKSWKTRTDIIKCRYLHRVLPSSSFFFHHNTVYTKIYALQPDLNIPLFDSGRKILRQERDEKLTSEM